MDLTWALPSRKPPKDLTIYRGKRDGACPDAKGKDSSAEFSTRAEDGRIKDSNVSPGAYCYTAVGLNEYGRPGKTA